ncbi:MAG TPA: SCO family protein [Gammaproteobacteria bacterium]|nr:SCO family protein [Gammaproteobacteria bacterium]
MSIAKNQIILAASLLAAMVIGVAFGMITSQQQKSTLRELQPTLKAATLYPEDFRPLAAFLLTDHNGLPFDNNRLQGGWSLVFFGYTYCPDVCPMTMQTLQVIKEEISAQPEIAAPRVVFVSVDPERDTAERLKQYVTFFGPDFTGVSGDHENLHSLTASLGVFYSKSENPQQPDRYQVDHSASLFLFGPDGRIRALFSAPLQAGTIAQDLVTIIKHG